MNQFITFCAIYRNEAGRIRYCLDLAKDVFTHIVIGVQKSEDDTLKICKEYADEVVERPEESPEESKDHIMAAVKTPWTFWLDADEYPSLSTIRQLEMIEIPDTIGYDAFSVIRINYVDGLEIEGGQGTDRQFRLIRSDVRWDTKKQGRRIHIHPIVVNPKQTNWTIYHHRTLQKIKNQTERWNQLESSTVTACNEYVKNVERELCQKRQK